MPGYTRESGNTLDVVGVCVNRIGMEDFMAVEAALDERDELAAKRRNASSAAQNSIDPSDDLPKTSDPA